jgi:hypothetical protein
MSATVAFLTILGWAVCAAPWTTAARSAAAAGTQQMQVFSEIDRQYQLSVEPCVLYLECSQASYYLGAPSFLRWFYPVPIQRVHSNPSLLDNKVHFDALRDLTEYSGRFVILDATWMRYSAELVPKMNEKLEAEYEEVWAADVLQDQGQTNRFMLLKRK